MTLDAAVATALARHPAILADAAAASAQNERVGAARADYLPSLEVSAQATYGTGNVVRGPLLGMPNVANVFGAAANAGLAGVSLGTAVGVGAAWNALGLPLQMAEVDTQLCRQGEARATLVAQRLNVAYAAADAFMEVLAAHETVRATQASVQRGRVFATIVGALVAQDLKPGADTSRAEAELALELTQQIRAEQAEAVSQVALARALGIAGQAVEVDPGNLLVAPTPVQQAPKRHPLLEKAAQAVYAAASQEKESAFAFLPRLDAMASLSARASGFSGGDGALPNVPNWVAGLVLSFPVFEVVALRARHAAASADLARRKAEEANVEQTLIAEVDTARVMVKGARLVLAQAPAAVAAARAAESQAEARYQNGLATAIEVVEAQKLLAKAELEDAVARLNVRRGELLLARAVGDLGPFFAAARAERP